MKETALVIMAAGIGSRFGGGIKQLEPVGPNGEIIMDYSIHDALEAGFDKVVFIIRRDLEKDFREIIGNRIEKIAKVEYAFQELDALPAGYEVTPGRTKPWGTGQAVLMVKGLVNCPFLVINADDYYGKEGFRLIHDYMVSEMDESGDVFAEYGIRAFPTTFMIDKEGNIFGYVESALTGDVMESIVQQTMSGKRTS